MGSLFAVAAELGNLGVLFAFKQAKGRQPASISPRSASLLHTGVGEEVKEDLENYVDIKERYRERERGDIRNVFLSNTKDQRFAKHTDPARAIL